MTKYVTYMSVTLHTDSATPTEIACVLKEHGWTPVYGPYDFSYSWTKDLNTADGTFENEFCTTIDDVHCKLAALNVWYNLRTFERGTENFTTITAR